MEHSQRHEPIRHMDLDIKVSIGHIRFNILYINFEPAIPAWHFKNHSHSSYELHFIPSGRGVLRVSDQQFPIEPGVFYLTGPDIYHEQQADDVDPMCEYCINFELEVTGRRKKKNDDYIETEVEEMLETLRNTHFWFGRDAFETIPLFEHLFAEVSSRKLGYYAYIQSLASQIIIHAIRNFADGDRAASYYFPRKILDDRRRFIADNYFKDSHLMLTPAELAGLIGVSVRQLERIMQLYYNKSFKEKLQESRLSHAKHLLSASALTAKDIAEATGFASAPYFCKVFKTCIGMTPLQYRAKKR
ncbi:helix-turn-helix transcriptional regulator [Paenibacillus gorillae]|uniref:helix-turn-helix transcriptional regulator n=1 Tax=Paenibacillus gorillae TaxID=1243662 RepID=UPI0004B08583|nr:AraC family transcriptional regulator [Paenibacillus gorillae]